MSIARRPLRRALAFVFLLAALAVPTFAAERARIRVENYVIDATLSPVQHRMAARARVRFTALEEIAIASFELHNGLRVTRVTDDSGKQLSAERVSQENTVRVALPEGLSKGASSELTFEYEGVLANADDSPVQGLKLAYLGDDISYLLYAGRWFPMVSYGTNRFTATMRITVPSEYKVIGSGLQGSAPAVKASTAPPPPPAKKGRKAPPRPTVTAVPDPGKTTYTFAWEKPSFPGTIIAGKFDETNASSGGLNVRVYFLPKNKAVAPVYGETAVKEFEFFSSLYGPPISRTLSVVELPADTVPNAWAPEIAAITARAIGEKTNYRLLANAISHQWWGATVSPATNSDFWLSDGFARFSEARYVEQAAGGAGFEEATKDMAVGALAYDTIPLNSVGRLDPFSPEFQSLTADKGGMIVNMLRWVIGDAAFDRTMRTFAQQFAGKPATSADFQKVAEAVSGEQLTPFFTQWLDSTGAPEFKNKYTIYRTPKGFRVVGEISQDLDLFRMPLELRVDTDGQSEMKRIEVVGTNSAYVVETFGKPRRISIDPNARVLKNSAELRVRSSILRGQQLVQTGDLTEALKEFQKALDNNKSSSLAHYRIAEVFFLQRNYQAAANAYREALNGDGDPHWTEVWSHIQLGKIFDITGQRERATNEYRQALQTNDNTQGAMTEARKYLEKPYSREQQQQEQGL